MPLLVASGLIVEQLIDPELVVVRTDGGWIGCLTLGHLRFYIDEVKAMVRLQMRRTINLEDYMCTPSQSRMAG